MEKLEIAPIMPMEADKFKYNIAPDFIYNHFEYWTTDIVTEILKISTHEGEYVLQVGVDGKEAYLGIWLFDIPVHVVNAVVDYIFNKYKKVRKIYYNGGVNPIGACYPCNHYRIVLPDSVEEFDKLASKKSRYNLRRSKRLLSEQLGSEITFTEYKINDSRIVEFMRDYFKFKQVGFPDEKVLNDKNEILAHLSDYHVTDIYVAECGANTVGIILSCEQCPIVFIENITYNPAYKDYSPGMIVYNYYLCRLIEKGKQELYLGVGDYEYKNRYKAIEECVYDGKCYRNYFLNAYHMWRSKLR